MQVFELCTCKLHTGRPEPSPNRRTVRQTLFALFAARLSYSPPYYIVAILHYVKARDVGTECIYLSNTLKKKSAHKNGLKLI